MGHPVVISQTNALVRYSPKADEGRLGELKAKFAGLLSKSAHLMKVQNRCPGYPKWYVELCEKPFTPEWDDCITNLTPSKRVTPMLLRFSVGSINNSLRLAIPFI